MPTRRSFAAHALPVLAVLGWPLLAGCARDAGAARAPTTLPAGVTAEASAVQRRYLADLAAAERAALGLERALGAITSAGDVAAARAAFVEARAAYKRVEGLVEYYAPAAADMLNGPVIPEMEADDPSKEVAPEGFQVVEEALYGEAPVAAAGEARVQAAIAAAHLRRVRSYAGNLLLTDLAIWDAARLEVARVATVGLGGLDSPVALRTFPEARAALAGVRATLEAYRARATPAQWAPLVQRFAALDVALAAATDWAAADRLTLLADHLEPLLVTLNDLRGALRIAVPAEPRLWRADAPSLFSPGAWDAQSLSPVHAPAVGDRAALAALGARLFADPILSREGDRACTTCHLPDRAYADGLPRAAARAGTGAVLRNTPTILNAGLQAASFADLRTTYLEDQVVDVVGNPAEMHGDLDGAAARLNADPAYSAAFRAAFAKDRAVPTGAPPVTPLRIRAALARHVRDLEALDSRFDRYVRGDRTALTAEERTGFNLFTGKAKCATCHFLPLFNGTVPPNFTKAEAEVLGVPATATTGRGRLDPDEGVYRVSRLPVQRHAFKTPTVRNAAVTAPYFHNGAYRTLDDVVRFYELGGGAGLGIALPNQTLPPDRLALRTSERGALVAFMRALTDTSSYRVRQAAAVRVVATR